MKIADARTLDEANFLVKYVLKMEGNCEIVKDHPNEVWKYSIYEKKEL